MTPVLPEPPALDLHPWCHDAGGDVTGALHAARMFLLEQLAQGAGEVHLIHGKGQGKLRDLIHHTLLREYQEQKLVLRYHLLAGNAGVTVVWLPAGRKTRALLQADPSQLKVKPFETLREQFRHQLEHPPAVAAAPSAPLPVIDGETRLGVQEFATLEEYARALVAERAAAVTPPAAAPRRLPKRKAGSSHVPADPELEGRLREARQLAAGEQAKPPGRGPGGKQK